MKPGGERERWWIVVLDTAAPDRRGDEKEEVGDAATEKEGMGQGNPMQTWTCGEEGRVMEGGKTRRGEAERMEMGRLLTSAHRS
jgi:hypothetical protein